MGADERRINFKTVTGETFHLFTSSSTTIGALRIRFADVHGFLPGSVKLCSRGGLLCDESVVRAAIAPDDCVIVVGKALPKDTTSSQTLTSLQCLSLLTSATQLDRPAPVAPPPAAQPPKQKPQTPQLKIPAHVAPRKNLGSGNARHMMARAPLPIAEPEPEDVVVQVPAPSGPDNAAIRALAAKTLVRNFALLAWRDRLPHLPSLLSKLRSLDKVDEATSATLLELASETLEMLPLDCGARLRLRDDDYHFLESRLTPAASICLRTLSSLDSESEKQQSAADLDQSIALFLVQGVLCHPLLAREDRRTMQQQRFDKLCTTLAKTLKSVPALNPSTAFFIACFDAPQPPQWLVAHSPFAFAVADTPSLNAKLSETIAKGSDGDALALRTLCGVLTNEAAGQTLLREHDFLAVISCQIEQQLASSQVATQDQYHLLLLRVTAAIAALRRLGQGSQPSLPFAANLLAWAIDHRLQIGIYSPLAALLALEILHTSPPEPAGISCLPALCSAAELAAKEKWLTPHLQDYGPHMAALAAEAAARLVSGQPTGTHQEYPVPALYAAVSGRCEYAWLDPLLEWTAVASVAKSLPDVRCLIDLLRLALGLPVFYQTQSYWLVHVAALGLVSKVSALTTALTDTELADSFTTILRLGAFLEKHPNAPSPTATPPPGLVHKTLTRKHLESLLMVLVESLPPFVVSPQPVLQELTAMVQTRIAHTSPETSTSYSLAGQLLCLFRSCSPRPPVPVDAVQRVQPIIDFVARLLEKPLVQDGCTGDGSANDLVALVCIRYLRLLSRSKSLADYIINHTTSVSLLLALLRTVAVSRSVLGLEACTVMQEWVAYGTLHKTGSPLAEVLTRALLRNTSVYGGHTTGLDHLLTALVANLEALRSRWSPTWAKTVLCITRTCRLLCHSPSEQTVLTLRRLLQPSCNWWDALSNVVHEFGPETNDAFSPEPGEVFVLPDELGKMGEALFSALRDGSPTRSTFVAALIDFLDFIGQRLVSAAKSVSRDAVARFLRGEMVLSVLNTVCQTPQFVLSGVRLFVTYVRFKFTEDEMSVLVDLVRENVVVHKLLQLLLQEVANGKSEAVELMANLWAPALLVPELLDALWEQLGSEATVPFLVATRGTLWARISANKTSGTSGSPSSVIALLFCFVDLALRQNGSPLPDEPVAGHLAASFMQGLRGHIPRTPAPSPFVSSAAALAFLSLGPLASSALAHSILSLLARRLPKEIFAALARARHSARALSKEGYHGVPPFPGILRWLLLAMMGAATHICVGGSQFVNVLAPVLVECENLDADDWCAEGERAAATVVFAAVESSTEALNLSRGPGFGTVVSLLRSRSLCARRATLDALHGFLVDDTAEGRISLVDKDVLQLLPQQLTSPLRTSYTPDPVMLALLGPDDDQRAVHAACLRVLNATATLHTQDGTHVLRQKLASLRSIKDSVAALCRQYQSDAQLTDELAKAQWWISEEEAERSRSKQRKLVAEEARVQRAEKTIREKEETRLKEIAEEEARREEVAREERARREEERRQQEEENRKRHEQRLQRQAELEEKRRKARAEKQHMQEQRTQAKEQAQREAHWADRETQIALRLSSLGIESAFCKSAISGSKFDILATEEIILEPFLDWLVENPPALRHDQLLYGGDPSKPSKRSTAVVVSGGGAVVRTETEAPTAANSTSESTSSSRGSRRQSRKRNAPEPSQTARLDENAFWQYDLAPAQVDDLRALLQDVQGESNDSRRYWEELQQQRCGILSEHPESLTILSLLYDNGQLKPQTVDHIDRIVRSVVDAQSGQSDQPKVYFLLVRLTENGLIRFLPDGKLTLTLFGYQVYKHPMVRNVVEETAPQESAEELAEDDEYEDDSPGWNHEQFLRTVIGDILVDGEGATDADLAPIFQLTNYEGLSF
eukprot:TRINITY_DN21393_c0_g1_i1.p1 TRINITY_DN21393_c0_g1~~TRINITY_DN21393_c0_g1_i1.p1  ORF type:complete len:1913 (+),score=311.39 TRINITY_DN21393_c0_g1_i1:32-5740(+)